jgi:hypothetical protein
MHAREVLSVDGVFKAAPEAHEAFSAANHAAGATIVGAGSADHEAMLSAAAAALGPIGASYLAAYGPAQANNIAATLLVGHVHHAIGLATTVHKATIVASESA